MTHKELIKKLTPSLTYSPSLALGAIPIINALRGVVEHLSEWEEWETRWEGHMSMTIAADEERNARYKVVNELMAIIEKELR